MFHTPFDEHLRGGRPIDLEHHASRHARQRYLEIAAEFGQHFT